MFGNSTLLPTLTSLPPPLPETKERKLKLKTASELRQEMMAQNLAISDSLMQIPLELECQGEGKGKGRGSSVWRGTFEEKFPNAKVYPSILKESLGNYKPRTPSRLKKKSETKAQHRHQQFRQVLVYSEVLQKFILGTMNLETGVVDTADSSSGGCSVVNDPKSVCLIMGAVGNCGGKDYQIPMR